MPKRKKSANSPRATLILAGITALLFLLGEGLVVARQDWGQILIARFLGLGDPAQVTRLVGKQIRRGLDAVGVPPDSVAEKTSDHEPSIHWRVGLASGASLIQANQAITQSLADQGAEVLTGRERPGRNGETVVTLVAGIRGRPTHEVVLVRWPRAEDAPEVFNARVAILLYGLGEDQALADAFIGSPLPVAVAIAPGAPWSSRLFKLAREHEREVVLHLPLEPIGYPQTSPGPGAILVTMKPLKITGTVKHYLDEAGPVTAVANLMGSLATQDITVMRAVFRELERRQVPFLHVSPAVGAVCRSLAGEMGVGYAQPDMILDGEARQETAAKLDAAWKRVLERAREDGKVVVMLRATPLALEWLPKAISSKRLKDVSVVPLAALLARPGAL